MLPLLAFVCFDWIYNNDGDRKARGGGGELDRGGTNKDEGWVFTTAGPTVLLLEAPAASFPASTRTITRVAAATASVTAACVAATTACVIAVATSAVASSVAAPLATSIASVRSCGRAAAAPSWPPLARAGNATVVAPDAGVAFCPRSPPERPMSHFSLTRRLHMQCLPCLGAGFCVGGQIWAYHTGSPTSRPWRC